MRLLFIAYYFPPLGGAGVQRTQKFVKYLAAEGISPIVVTGPASVDNRWSPLDATLDREIPPQVEVYRVPGPVPGGGNTIQRRFRKLLSLPQPYSQWWVRGGIHAASNVGAGVDLILATMSPFESAEIAAKLSKQFNVPWVADLRDPWALDEMQVYPSALHRSIETMKMRRLLSTAELIIMNTPEAVAALKVAFPKFRENRALSITNGFDEDDFMPPTLARPDSKFRIVHSGFLHTNAGLQFRKQSWQRLLGGAAPGVDVLTRSHTFLLEAVDRWCTRNPHVSADLELVFAGAYTSDDRAIASRSSVTKAISFTGYIPHSASVALIRSADLLFFPMHNLPVGRRARIVPGKLYEYMASGRPILAAVPDGDARDFLIQCGTAFVCRPDDVEEMSRILDRVYCAWKEKCPFPMVARQFVARFGRRSLTAELAAALRSLVPLSTALC